jgi:hypothetical protein
LLLIALVLLVGAWEWSAFLQTRATDADRVRRDDRGFGVLVFDPRALAPFELDLLLVTSAIWWLAAFAWIVPRAGRNLARCSPRSPACSP